MKNIIRKYTYVCKIILCILFLAPIVIGINFRNAANDQDLQTK